MRVLIVDDDYVSRIKLKALLAPFADCDAVPDGALAVSMFEKAHRESVPYDLITMDVDMPGMSGQEAVQKIRQWEQEHRAYRSAAGEVRVLMVTIKKDPGTIITSFRDGCEWYLIKPVTPEKLRDAFARLGFAEDAAQARKG